MTSYTVDQFVQLETQIWKALASGDAAADERLLSDDFLGVYASGFAGKAEHAGQLLAGPMVSDYELSDARVQVLADGLVLLAYRAQWARCKDGRVGARETMYVTSIWRLSDGVWMNVFSQDTSANEPEA
jgi:hypothetical protein